MLETHEVNRLSLFILGGKMICKLFAKSLDIFIKFVLLPAQSFFWTKLPRTLKVLVMSLLYNILSINMKKQNMNISTSCSKLIIIITRL